MYILVYATALKYLPNEQLKYTSIELQDYLNPFANIKLEDQRYLFSLRTKINHIKINFPKDKI